MVQRATNALTMQRFNLQMITFYFMLQRVSQPRCLLVSVISSLTQTLVTRSGSEQSPKFCNGCKNQQSSCSPPSQVDNNWNLFSVCSNHFPPDCFRGTSQTRVHFRPQGRTDTDLKLENCRFFYELGDSTY